MIVRVILSNIILLSIILVGFSACGDSDLVYHPTVAQGSAVRVEDAQKLIIGMSRLEVATLVGTPMNVDPFNQNHWTYRYISKSPTSALCHRGIDIYFKNDKLVRKIKLNTHNCPVIAAKV